MDDASLPDDGTSGPGEVHQDPGRVLHGFFREVARTINSGRSHAVLLHGNVHDLFRSGEGEGLDAYGSLVDLLRERCDVPGITTLVYELNGPIRTRSGAQTDALRSAWVAWQLGLHPDEATLHSLVDRKAARRREHLESEFDRRVLDAVGQPTLAIEFLRQLMLCSRSKAPNGRAYLADQLLVIIESADLLVPAGREDIAGMSAADRHRLSILQDWFTDPGFQRARDAVILISETQSGVHPRVSRLPTVASVEVPDPDEASRSRFLQDAGRDDDAERVARLSAGLPLHALRRVVATSEGRIEESAVIAEVERSIMDRLGEDVIEFTKPKHRLDDVVGATRLKQFLARELVPRFRDTGGAALPGAAVAGPIGSGKTFIFEAVASELGVPVLTLKNIRSQWFGQTDVIFENLRRVLESLGKVVIFVDEADTQFGAVGSDAHPTERRLTGKIQQMMSDSRLRGKVIWLLMTARIHLLSSDIRRPGRVGDLIIPVLDPEGDDLRAFARWTVAPALPENADPDEVVGTLLPSFEGYSAAAFAALRSRLIAERSLGDDPSRGLDAQDIRHVLEDQIPPAIGKTRRFQTLQALINTTRRSLLPEGDTGDREAWEREIREIGEH